MDGQTEELCCEWTNRRTFLWMDRQKNFAMDGQKKELCYGWTEERASIWIDRRKNFFCGWTDGRANVRDGAPGRERVNTNFGCVKLWIKVSILTC